MTRLLLLLPLLLLLLAAPAQATLVGGSVRDPDGYPGDVNINMTVRVWQVGADGSETALPVVRPPSDQARWQVGTDEDPDRELAPGTRLHIQAATHAHAFTSLENFCSLVSPPHITEVRLTVPEAARYEVEEFVGSPMVPRYYQPQLDQLELEFLELLNQARREVGAGPVETVEAANYAADGYSAYTYPLVSRRDWDTAWKPHRGPECEDPHGRMLEVGIDRGYGEVVIHGGGLVSGGAGSSPAAALAGWKKSPGHWNFLMAPSLHWVGIGHVNGPRTGVWVLDSVLENWKTIRPIPQRPRFVLAPDEQPQPPAEPQDLEAELLSEQPRAGRSFQLRVCGKAGQAVQVSWGDQQRSLALNDEGCARIAVTVQRHTRFRFVQGDQQQLLLVRVRANLRLRRQGGQLLIQLQPGEQRQLQLQLQLQREGRWQRQLLTTDPSGQARMRLGRARRVRVAVRGRSGAYLGGQASWRRR